MGGITREKQGEKREALARLTAPQHLTTTHFLEHRKVEGYEQDREVHDFFGRGGSGVMHRLRAIRAEA